MNFKTLYDTIATKAVEANTRFSQGYEEESLKLLEEVAKTIALIQDFKAKWTFLPKRGRPPKIDRPFKIARMDDVICVSGEARLMFNEPPVPAACPPAHIIQTIPVMDAPPSLSLDLNDESDDEEEAWAANAQMVLDPDLARRLDEVFFGFLARICSDLDAVDATGEKIMEYGNPATNDLTIFFVSDFPGTRHHTLLARKLSKVAESEGFHPFKFRIRSFSNAFRDELNKAGYTPAVMDNKKAKFYLWHQRYIARYNEDGKLAKSKGTNVWVVEGKKTADGGWIFKEFERKIILPYPMPTAYIGRRWSIEPKVYDPQVKGPKAFFSSPWLPEWLEWKNNCLTGLPRTHSQSCEILIVASYYHGEFCYTIEKPVHIHIAMSSPAVGEAAVNGGTGSSDSLFPESSDSPSPLGSGAGASFDGDWSGSVERDTLSVFDADGGVCVGGTGNDDGRTSTEQNQTFASEVEVHG